MSAQTKVEPIYINANFFMDENKPSSSDPSAPGSSAEAGSDHVDNQQGSAPTDPPQNPTEGQEDVLVLEALSKLAGREGDRAFKSKEDYEKHYKELSSHVGKPKQEVTPPETTPPETPAAPAEKTPEGEGSGVKELTAQVEKSEFLRRHPEAEEDIDMVTRSAGDNDLSLEEAYKRDDLTTLLSDIRAGREKRNSESGIESNQRIGESGPEISDDVRAAASAGDSKAQDEVVNKMVIDKLK